LIWSVEQSYRHTPQICDYALVPIVMALTVEPLGGDYFWTKSWE
jgi:hypothetical protein